MVSMTAMEIKQLLTIWDRIAYVAPEANGEFNEKQDLLNEPPAEKLCREKAQRVDEEHWKECKQYECEAKALRKLRESKCSSAPKHLADFQADGKNPWVTDYSFWFVVMTMLPGRSMADVWDRPQPTNSKDKEVPLIWSAFKKAML